MNATSLPISDTDSANISDNMTKQSTSALSEIVTLLLMYLVTAAISLALTLTWVL
ncbi:hypothetical protein [Vibrio sp. qd031]|uniref:hypothetical protein n=1 Tax=Vibrio sp. qd031 TaxID=1603038 RepID=UPI001553EB30|nr:hypothetical protein [Vibrio sp. qd031]